MTQWSVGDYTPWGNPTLPPDKIQWAGLTHIGYWGAVVHADGGLDLDTQLVSTTGKTLIALAHANGVKVILNLIQADWVSQANTFQPAITSRLTTLVANVMSVVNSYGFDGVDIDWEPFSTNTNGPSMLQLAAALRTALGTKILTVDTIGSDYAWWGTAHSRFDRIQVMTYDMSGPSWDPYSWHNSALYGPPTNAVWSVDLATKRYIAAGVPANKLSIGIPFYGWQWTGGGITKPMQPWGATKPTGKQIYTQALGPNIAAGVKNLDTLAQVPYVSGTNSFLSYDDEASVAAKVKYAIDKGLGGWIVWELASDYVPTQAIDQPLLNSIKTVIGGGLTPLPPPPPPPVLARRKNTKDRRSWGA